MILMVKQAVRNFILFKLLKACWIINAMLWNFIEHSSDELIQNSIRSSETSSSTLLTSSLWTVSETDLTLYICMKYIWKFVYSPLMPVVLNHKKTGRNAYVAGSCSTRRPKSTSLSPGRGALDK